MPGAQLSNAYRKYIFGKFGPNNSGHTESVQKNTSHNFSLKSEQLQSCIGEGVLKTFGLRVFVDGRYLTLSILMGYRQQSLQRDYFLLRIECSEKQAPTQQEVKSNKMRAATKCFGKKGSMTRTKWSGMNNWEKCATWTTGKTFC